MSRLAYYGAMTRLMFVLSLALLSMLPPLLQAAGLDHELKLLQQRIAGKFDNTQQVATGENLLREGIADPTRAPDPLYPIFSLIEAPAIGEHVVYLQWHQGSADGPLQRQRIWVFTVDEERNAVMMDFYTLQEPARWRDAHLSPASAARDMTLADLLPYPSSCRLPFRRHIDVFIGEIPKGDCRIVSQQTRTEMIINARIVVGAEQLWYEESGVRPDGTTVFRVPVSGSYQFRRRPDF
jgi:hypothetical protein